MFVKYANWWITYYFIYGALFAIYPYLYIKMKTILKKLIFYRLFCIIFDLKCNKCNFYKSPFPIKHVKYTYKVLFIFKLNYKLISKPVHNIVYYCLIFCIEKRTRAQTKC